MKFTTTVIGKIHIISSIMFFLTKLPIRSLLYAFSYRHHEWLRDEK